MGASESRNKYLPKQFSDAAFRSASGEAAWTLKMVADVVDWLGQNGYGVLGAEVWIVTPTGEICTLYTDAEGQLACWAMAVNRNEDEPWTTFAARAAAQVRESIRAFDATDVETLGEVRMNLTWVSESEFNALGDNGR